MSDRRDDGEANVLIKQRVKRPSLYTVVIVNDDFTPMDFVVKVIVSVFYLSLEEATHLMLKVHKEGKAGIGSFTFEIAEHKAFLVTELAKKEEHPLQAYPEQI